MDRRSLSQLEAEFQQWLGRTLEQERQRLREANAAREELLRGRGELSMGVNPKASKKEKKHESQQEPRTRT